MSLFSSVYHHLGPVRLRVTQGNRIRLPGLSRLSLSTSSRQALAASTAVPFVRGDRVTANVAVLGASQHGKTSLTSALSLVSSLGHPGEVTFKPRSEIGSAKERQTGQSEHGSHLEWLGLDDHVRFAHTDLPGHKRYIKNLLVCLFQLEAVVIVVRAEEGVVEETKEHYRSAKHAGVHHIAFFINHTADDGESAELDQLIQDDLAELASAEELKDNLVSGNLNRALKKEPEALKSIERLSSILEKTPIPSTRTADAEKPLYFPLEQVGNIPRRGIFCAGRLKEGRLNKENGSTAELFFEDHISRVNMRDLEIFRRPTLELLPGDRGGSFVKLKSDLAVKRGAVLLGPAWRDVRGCSRRWKVQLKQELPSQLASLNVHHATREESLVTVSRDTKSDDHVELSFKSQVIAQPGEPLVMRHAGQYLLANFLRPVD